MACLTRAEKLQVCRAPSCRHGSNIFSPFDAGLSEHGAEGRQVLWKHHKADDLVVGHVGIGNRLRTFWAWDFFRIPQEVRVISGSCIPEGATAALAQMMNDDLLESVELAARVACVFEVYGHSPIRPTLRMEEGHPDGKVEIVLHKRSA